MRRKIAPTLLMLSGETPGRLFDLKRDVTTIGRNPDSDIVLAHKSVSWDHAQVVRKERTYFLQEERKSHNGTYLEGKRLVAPSPLRDGNQIQICNNLFAFKENAVDVQDEGDSAIVGVVETSTPEGMTISIEVGAEEKLRALLEIGRILGDTLHLKEIMERTLGSLFQIFPEADRGFVLLRPEGAADLVPVAIRDRRGGAGHLSISRTIVDHVMNEGKAILSADAALEFGPTRSITDAALGTMMAAPLLDRDRRPVGIIQVEIRDRHGRFEQEDLDLIVAVAGQVGVAAENARLHEALLRQVKLDQMAHDAHDVQKAMLPVHRPQAVGYEFWDFYEPALYVGGDLFDYLPVAPPDAPAGRWALILGDVAGKGMPAALLMVKFCCDVRRLIALEQDPTRLIERLNQQLCETTMQDRFITCLLALLDVEANRLTVVNAGHPVPLIRRADGRVESLGEESAGLPLALEPDQAYPAVETTIGPGDVVVFYTDGVSEASDAADVFFRTDRVVRELKAATGGPARVGESILQAVRRHAAGCPQSDDITLLCFGRPRSGNA